MSESPTYDVQLAIYDLSQGMARQLSAQFLGPDFALDIIPHTALVVYGKEYFFGGGIQQADPMVFRNTMGVYPVDVKSIGRTSVNQAEFEQWCQQAMQTGRWTADRYDLLHHNCNNFSHDAALNGLKLPQGVPDWILNVPQRFLSSPMGQMVRPMLENMQMTAGAGGSSPMGAAAPFANMPSSAMRMSPPAASTAPSVAVNPWANMPPRQQPSRSTTADNSATTTTTTASTKKESSAVAATPTLDSFGKPFISRDVKTVTLCVKKLSEKLEGSKQDSMQALVEIGSTLEKGSKPTSDSVDKACGVILEFLNTHSSVSFALMLLRVVVLHAAGAEHFVLQCMKLLHTELTSETTSELLKTTATRSLAWVSMSNAATIAQVSFSSLVPSMDGLVDAAVSDISQDSNQPSEIRQAAAAFLYNLTVHEQFAKDFNLGDDELADVIVSMICGSMDNLVAETNGTTRLRRLMVVGRIIKPTTGPVHTAAKQLILDLGFLDAIREMSTETTNAGGDMALCTKLASELVHLLES